MDLTKLSATEIAIAIEAGDTNCEAVTSALLDRIEEREPMVEAWEYLDPDAVLAAARKLDGLPSCLLYTSPSPRDRQKSRMPSSA